MKKASDFVSEGHKAINSAMDSIDKALQAADSPANREILERCKSNLSSTCSELSNFTD